MLNRCLNGSYRLEKKIGSGTFSMQTTSSPLIFGLKLIGEVFLACDFLLVQDVVIKLEPLKARQHFLEHEYHVYQKLSRIEGIPNPHWFGVKVVSMQWPSTAWVHHLKTFSCAATPNSHCQLFYFSLTS
jgi:hypothetical protein